MRVIHFYFLRLVMPWKICAADQKLPLFALGYVRAIPTSFRAPRPHPSSKSILKLAWKACD